MSFIKANNSFIAKSCFTSFEISIFRKCTIRRNNHHIFFFIKLIFKVILFVTKIIFKLIVFINITYIVQSCYIEINLTRLFIIFAIGKHITCFKKRNYMIEFIVIKVILFLNIFFITYPITRKRFFHGMINNHVFYIGIVQFHRILQCNIQ